MTSILVPGTFTDSILPSDADMKTYLASLTSLRYWMQADDETATVVSGLVTSFDDVRPSSPRKFTQATSARQVPLLADATINGYTSANFDGTSNDYIYNEAFDASGTFSFISLVKPTADSQMTIISNRTGDLVQSTVYTTSDRNVRMLHRGAQAVSGYILPTTTPTLVIGVGTDTSVKIGVNGGLPISVAAVGAASTGSLYLSRLGTIDSNYWVGDMSDIMIFDLDIYAVENSDLLADVVAYFKETYNLDI